jgi:hypothetical protein
MLVEVSLKIQLLDPWILSDFLPPSRLRRCSFALRVLLFGFWSSFFAFAFFSDGLEALVRSSVIHRP